METTFRRGTPDDARACGVICYEAFKAIADQHNFAPDFPSIDVAVGLVQLALSRTDVYSIVAEADGRVVGSNFLWEGDTIAGIGPISVQPSVQNGSIGRGLMERALQQARAKRFVGVRLAQVAYHNRSMALYTKLGFDAREPLSCMQGPALEVEVPGYRVRPAAPSDANRCNRLCWEVHGHDRQQEVADAIAQGTARVVEHLGTITGYATNIGFFAHAVGRTNDDLKALIGAAESFHGPGFLVPTRNADLFRWCLQHGLRVTQPLTLMSMGLYQKPSGAFLPSVLY